MLNCNCWTDRLDCLSSLEKLDYSNYKVIVADNDSIDGSETKNTAQTSAYCHGAKSVYELARRRSPDIQPGTRREAAVELPEDISLDTGRWDEIETMTDFARLVVGIGKQEAGGRTSRSVGRDA